MNSVLGLCLCLVLVCLITTGATGGTAGFSANGKPPEIVLLAVSSLVLNDGDAALYTFVVKGATKIEVIEAGNTIKEINNPSSATLKGTANGLPAYAIQTGDSNTFNTVLRASNGSGLVFGMLTLSFATLPTAAGQPWLMDNQTEPRLPKWLDQYSSSLRLTRSATVGSEPKFFKCPDGCPYCLTPDDAASRGFTQKCSDERCYYSPDDQQNWYCYSEPVGYCCKAGQAGQVGQVVEATKSKCAQTGGAWYLNQTDAIQACQPVGWCCRDGQLAQFTKTQCAQVGGSYWSTNQAQTMDRCQPMGYCCRDGQVYTATQAQCNQTGGSNWSTNQYRTVDSCRPQTCWCCAGGKVYQTTQAQCAQAGGNCYDSQSQATAACRQVAMCWCCSGGKVSYITQAEAQKSGTCYSTQSQADAACRKITTPTYLR
jgi:hypothetical protein